ncbi:nuclear transport factor 2 family protein [Chloroflexota bacterium]
MTPDELEKRLAATENAVKDLEKRLQTTQDIDEVKKLHYRYIDALMLCEWDRITDMFAENSTFDVAGPKGVTVRKGKTDIEKYFKENLALTHVGKEGDVLVHPDISVEGDKATGRWWLYMMYYHPQTYQSLLWVQGVYDMEYVKVNGQWKFSYLKFRPRIEPPDGPPNPEYVLNFLKKISS